MSVHASRRQFHCARRATETVQADRQAAFMPPASSPPGSRSLTRRHHRRSVANVPFTKRPAVSPLKPAGTHLLCTSVHANSPPPGAATEKLSPLVCPPCRPSLSTIVTVLWLREWLGVDGPTDRERSSALPPPPNEKPVCWCVGVEGVGVGDCAPEGAEGEARPLRP